MTIIYFVLFIIYIGRDGKNKENQTIHHGEKNSSERKGNSGPQVFDRRKCLSRKKNDTVEAWQGIRQALRSVSVELLCPPENTS